MGSLGRLVQRNSDTAKYDGGPDSNKHKFPDGHGSAMIVGIANPQSFMALVSQRTPHCGTTGSAYFAVFQKRPFLGRGWQTGQVWDERFINCSRRIVEWIPAAAHRPQGCPSLP